MGDPLCRCGQRRRALTAQEINERLLRDLRTTGVVSADEEVIRLLDGSFSDKSLLVPVERKKDGSFAASSSVITRENYRIVSEFVSRRIRQTGREILEGNIAINPCGDALESACTYCDYRAICSYDGRVGGYERRILPKLTQDEILMKMMEELEMDETAERGEEPWR